MSPASTQRPTLEMVAKEAGVSRATVSRVVNGLPTVNPQMTEIVQAAIERLEYVPNHSARSLARRVTNVVALVVPESTTKFFRDPFFVSAVDGIAARLEVSAYMLNLLVTAREPRAKVERFLRSGTVDGTIVLAHSSGDAFLADLNSSAPTVFGGRPLDDLAPHYYVDADNAGGAAAAARHLIDRGRTRLATITGSSSMAVGRDRLEGFIKEVHKHGLMPPVVVPADFTPESAASAARAMLVDHPEVDGVFVASDRMAAEALAVFSAAGRSVPQDIALVGFGDADIARETNPPLTTIRQPSFQMGGVLADTVLRLIAGDDTVERHVIMPAELVTRATT